MVGPYMRDPRGYGQIRLESTCPAVRPAAQGKEHIMAEITEREQRQIDQANSSGKTPVVFIHGLWLLPSSWDNWVGLRRTATRV
jgi:pimeloyl-ACP methyl ester carboxylesterase